MPRVIRRIPARGRKPTIDFKSSLAAWCSSHGLPAAIKEHRFHPTRQWRFDYAWPEFKIAIEIHGAVYDGRWGGAKGKAGRHTRGKGFEEDRVKMNSAMCLGWKVIEASTGQVKSGKVWGWLESVWGVNSNAGT